MAQNTEYPDRKMYMSMKKKTGEKKKVHFTYCRNNLSQNDFVKTEDNRWLFVDEYSRYGVTITIRITVKGNLYSVFMINGSKLKIRGGLEHFGIIVKRASNQIPWEIHIDKDDVICDISCQGNYGYAIGKETSRINKKKRENQLKRMKRVQSRGTKSVSIPKRVSWSISHPFQGGGVSPR